MKKTIFTFDAFLWPKSTFSSIGLLKLLKNTKFLHCDSTKNISFLNFCILTQERGIGSKKIISGFLLPPNKVEAYLPVCCKSQHFWHTMKYCFHQKQQLCCYYWKWLSWCNGHQSLFDYHHQCHNFIFSLSNSVP